MNLAELRGLQDWHLRYALTGVPGVAEVASIGGFEKQYQVDVDPARLQAYGVPITRVMTAIQNANADVGAMVMELSEREYMVRGLGYLKSIGDIENVVVGATSSGTPIRVAELGRVTVGPAVRRGLADLNGRGDAVGGIVVMRWGENALATIDRVKARLAELEAEPSSRRRGATGLRPERPDPSSHRHPAREAGGGEHRGRARLRGVPAPCSLGARRHHHASDRNPDGLSGHAGGRSGRGHHVARRHCHRDRCHDRRRHRHDREHAQAPRARRSGAIRRCRETAVGSIPGC